MNDKKTAVIFLKIILVCDIINDYFCKKITRLDNAILFLNYFGFSASNIYVTNCRPIYKTIKREDEICRTLSRLYIFSLL